MKAVMASEVFTSEERQQMLDIVRNSRLDHRPAALEIAEKVITPILSRINAKVGGEVDAMDLAYAAEFAINQFLDGSAGIIGTSIPMAKYPEGPVN